MMIMFPLTFLSNAFVPVDTLPDWLQAFVKVNPVSHVVTAVRDLMNDGQVTAEVGWALLGCAVVVAIFAPLSVRSYKQAPVTPREGVLDSRLASASSLDQARPTTLDRPGPPRGGPGRGVRRTRRRSRPSTPGRRALGDAAAAGPGHRRDAPVVGEPVGEHQQPHASSAGPARASRSSPQPPRPKSANPQTG